MNDQHRTLTAVLAAFGAVSLDTISTVCAIAASIVAMLAGWPAAVRTVRGFIAFFRKSPTA
ncbi:MAG: hypothetical protein WC661_10220 [Opitutaceae bacterium]|jgi:hypothetical protein